MRASPRVTRDGRRDSGVFARVAVGALSEVDPARHTCPVCRFYGYSDRMSPVDRGAVQHHPSCPTLAGPATRVGAAPHFFTSPDELRKYIDREDGAIHSLESDMHRQLVYDDPDALRARAEVFRGLADAPPPASALGGDAGLKKYVDAQSAAAGALDSEAAMLEARIAKLPVKTVLSQQTWSAAYRDLVRRWEEFVKANRDETIVDVNGEWDSVDGFDSEYRSAYDRFPSVSGGKAPSLPKPPTPEEIAAAHPDPNAFPWTLAIVVAGVAAVALVVWKVL